MLEAFLSGKVISTEAPHSICQEEIEVHVVFLSQEMLLGKHKNPVIQIYFVVQL